MEVVNSAGTNDYIVDGSRRIHRNNATAKGWEFNTGLGMYKDQAGGMDYFVDYRDNVGSLRLQPQYGNTSNVKTVTNMPFGDALFTSGGNMIPSNKEFFAGLWKESAVNYHADARDFNATQGRWMSVDPARSGWNAYMYADNHPVSENDPAGLEGDEAPPVDPQGFIWWNTWFLRCGI